MRTAKLFVASVLAGAMLLAGGTVAQAAPAAPTPSRDERAARIAAQELRETGFTEFTGADGQLYQARMTNGTLIIDTKEAMESRASTTGLESDPVQPMSLWCDLKVAAAITAISAVGIGFVAWMIAGLPEATVVVIAGISLRVITWRTVILLWGTGAALQNFLAEVLC